MSAKTQHNNILLAVLGFVTVVIVVGLIGFFLLDRSPDIIQGEVEVSEYRISSKVPGRILELRVNEGDYVHVGDTLAILDAPEVQAKKTQAQSAEDAEVLYLSCDISVICEVSAADGQNACLRQSCFQRL